MKFFLIIITLFVSFFGVFADTQTHHGTINSAADQNAGLGYVTTLQPGTYTFTYLSGRNNQGVFTSQNHINYNQQLITWPSGWDGPTSGTFTFTEAVDICVFAVWGPYPADYSFTITGNSLLDITNPADSAVVNIESNGGGSITFFASGGSEPYTFSYSGPGVYSSDTHSAVHILLSAGDYPASVTVQDSASQSHTHNFTIHVTDNPQSSDLEITSPVDGETIPCTADIETSVSFSASGGTAPYTYTWSKDGVSGSGSSMLVTLSSGSIACSVTVTDSASHTHTHSFFVEVSGGEGGDDPGEFELPEMPNLKALFEKLSLPLDQFKTLGDDDMYIDFTIDVSEVCRFVGPLPIVWHMADSSPTNDFLRAVRAVIHAASIFFLSLLFVLALYRLMNPSTS